MTTPQELVDMLCGPGYQAVQLKRGDKYRLIGVSPQGYKATAFVRDEPMPDLEIVEMEKQKEGAQ